MVFEALDEWKTLVIARRNIVQAEVTWEGISVGVSDENPGKFL